MQVQEIQNVEQSRGNWPSASAAQANRLCPGRHLMQQGLPEGPKDPDAESGQAIHAAWCGKPYRDLMDGEGQALAQLQMLEFRAVNEWSTSCGYEYREHRLWHEFPHGGRILKCSGQADVIHFAECRALIIDGKTGHKASVKESENLQLRWLVALTSINFPEVREITVLLAQNWHKKNPPCVYDAADLELAKEEMERDVAACYVANAPRNPSPVACEWCKGKKLCPEFLAQTMPFDTNDGAHWHPAPITSEKNISESIARLDNATLGQFLSMLRLADDAADSELRSRLKAGASDTGWKLSPGRTIEKIIDPQLAFNRCAESGVTNDQFLKCVTIRKGELKKAFAEATGKKGKDLDQSFSQMIEPACEWSKGSEVLERIK